MGDMQWKEQHNDTGTTFFASSIASMERCDVIVQSKGAGFNFEALQYFTK